MSCDNCDTFKHQKKNTTLGLNPNQGNIPLDDPLESCVQQGSIFKDRIEFPTLALKSTHINPVYGKRFPYMKKKTNGSYMSQDARLSYSRAAWKNKSRMDLNEPPLYMTPKLENIYHPMHSGYGTKYQTNYSDLIPGQIQYYIPEDQKNVLTKPLFAEPTRVTGSVYIDPMGGVKSEYKQKIPYINPFSTKPNTRLHHECTDFINATNFHRNDILFNQMRVRHREKFSSRWY